MDLEKLEQDYAEYQTMHKDTWNALLAYSKTLKTEKSEAEARAFEMSQKYHDAVEAPSAPVVTVETRKFTDLLAAWGNAEQGGAAGAAADALIAHIDAHTAAAVAQARAAALAFLQPAYEAMQMRAIGAEEKLEQAAVDILALHGRQREDGNKIDEQADALNEVTAQRDALREQLGVACLAKENAVQQAQQHAMEARTQRGTVLDILRHFGCPEEDWHALSLVKAALASPQQHAQAAQPDAGTPLARLEWILAELGKLFPDESIKYGAAPPELAYFERIVRLVAAQPLLAQAEPLSQPAAAGNAGAVAQHSRPEDTDWAYQQGRAAGLAEGRSGKNE
jgi:hypothetical protein